MDVTLLIRFAAAFAASSFAKCGKTIGSFRRNVLNVKFKQELPADSGTDKALCITASEPQWPSQWKFSS